MAKQIPLKDDLEKINNVFVDEEAPVEFLQFLEQTADENQISINVSLLPQREGGLVFSFLDFKVSLKGNYLDCLGFLSKLETAPYLVEIATLNIRKLAISEGGSGASPGASLKNVNFDLSIKVFTNKTTNLP